MTLTDVLLAVGIVVMLWGTLEVRRLRQKLGVVIFLWPTQMLAQTPQSEVEAALADCAKLDANTAQQTRYLTVANITPKDRAVYLKTLDVIVNGMSREGELVRCRVVSPTLVALCCDDYGWELTTYGGILHEREPYYHVRLLHGKEKTTAHAPWLPTEAIGKLSKATNSLVPILRADWFIHEVCQPKNYYQFLGIKKLADLDKAIGLDRKLIESKRKDLAAIVEKSSVAINPRSIFRFQSSMGSYWETRDNDDPKGFNNPLRHLDKDHNFSFLEIYATAPNGLYYTVLANAKGELAETAPDTVASDSTPQTPDRRVKPPLCAVCHSGSLQPIDDYARRTFGGGADIALGVPADRDKAKRLRSLYLGPIQQEFATDKERFARSLKDCSGMTPAEYGKGLAQVYYGYEAMLTQDDVARELGVTKERLSASLKTYLQIKGVSDLGLAGYAKGQPVLRTLHEEMMPLLAEIVYTVPIGGKP